MEVDSEKSVSKVDRLRARGEKVAGERLAQRSGREVGETPAGGRPKSGRPPAGVIGDPSPGVGSAPAAEAGEAAEEAAGGSGVAAGLNLGEAGLPDRGQATGPGVRVGRRDRGLGRNGDDGLGWLGRGPETVTVGVATGAVGVVAGVVGLATGVAGLVSSWWNSGTRVWSALLMAPGAMSRLTVPVERNSPARLNFTVRLSTQLRLEAWAGLPGLRPLPERSRSVAWTELRSTGREKVTVTDFVEALTPETPEPSGASPGAR